MNPYSPPSGEIVHTPQHNRFAIGFRRSILAAIIASTTCVVLALVAKTIDWLIPGEGALNDATIFGILRDATLVFTLLVMICFFSTFAYYAGAKRLNAGVCVIVVFTSGLVGAWFLSALGYDSPRRLRMEHPPLYLSELVTYIVPYVVSSVVLTLIGNSRTLQNARPNNPMDRSGGSAAS
jgi:hypothetical protein